MSQADVRPPYAGPQANPWAAPPSGPPQLPGNHGTGRARRRPGWPGVVVASLLAAALASGATLAGAQALDDDPAAAPSASPTADAPVPLPADGASPDWTAVAAAVAPSVVTIGVAGPAGSGQGSGVVLDTEGNILTNNHVVAGAGQGATIGVVLSDGRVFSDVEVVGTDATTDLAVVKITDPPSDLTPATLGDSSEVVVGQEVMALGNPLGLSGTVTTGIVSAVDRPVTTQEEQPTPQNPFGGQGGAQGQAEPVVTNAIQTDAAINPGNSGGALVDATGALIGINSSIASTSAQSGNIGIGFAIPVNEAKRISDELLADGTADHALLGVSLSDGGGTADGSTRQGAEVAEVSPGSAAEQGGLQVGDTVVAIDGDEVTGAESLTAHVRERAPGTEVTLSVVRDGQSLDVPVVLGTRED